MSFIKHLIVALFLGMMAFQTQANLDNKAKIEGLNLSTQSDTRSMVVEYQGRLIGNPELTIRERMVQIEVPNSYVWPRIEKKSTINQQNDTTLMAYQFEQDVVRVRAMLPFSLKGQEDRVSVVMRDGKIELNFPAPPAAKRAETTRAVAPAVVAQESTPQAEAPSVKKEARNLDTASYDETFLQNLIKESDFDNVAYAPEEELADTVNVQMAATERVGGEGFSMTGYIVKFLAFLGLVLLLFYGVVHLMKRGFLKKGSLGFLNSTKLVEVLNTTHLAPKRSLMLIKAHNQVFLVGSSETGLNLISEIKDVNGLIKEGERSVAGNNFDTTLNQAQTYSKDFKLKDEVLSSPSKSTGEAASESGLAQLLDEKPVQDSVKLSDQIKNRVKGLKSLQ